MTDAEAIAAVASGQELTLADLQSLFQDGETWCLKALAIQTNTPSAALRKLLTRRNGFSTHEGRWSWSPALAWLAMMEDAA